MESNNSSSRQIVYAIRKIAGVAGMKQARFMTANVDLVNEADRELNCTVVLGESEIKLTGVKLQSEANDGFILLPKVDTDILICLMPDNSSYMVLCNDIDKCICVVDENNKYEFDLNGFVFNGGMNGGLINIINQTAKLNQLVAELQAQLALIATGIAAGGGSYTPGALSQFNKSDYEDTKIKH